MLEFQKSSSTGTHATEKQGCYQFPVLIKHVLFCRARVRMDGEDVLGQKILVGNPQIARSASVGAENRPSKHFVLFLWLILLIFLFI